MTADEMRKHASVLRDYAHNCPDKIDGGPGIEESVYAGAEALEKAADQLAAPVGEQEWQPIEVGDWVAHTYYGSCDVACIENEAQADIARRLFTNASLEIRKADGRIWRKP